MATASFSSLPTEDQSGANDAMLQELDLEGDISTPVNLNTDDSSTLDEPIKDTFLRDAKAIGTKFKQIFLPMQSKQQLLRDWDLWGPLIICVVLALLMQGNCLSVIFFQAYLPRRRFPYEVYDFISTSKNSPSQWPSGNARFDFDGTSQFHHPVMHRDEF